MLSTAIIVFREVLEIAMILSVVLAATRGLPGRALWIGIGFSGGILGAALVAAFADAISNAASGMGQECFNALILFTAAIVIGWTALWMRGHARDLVAELRQTGQDVIAGRLPGFSLSLIIGLAILREGSEIVMFLYGMLLSGQTLASVVMGSVIGVALGLVAGAALYLGLVKLSAKYMLKVTGWLLMLLVAGLSAQGAGYLTAAGYFSHFTKPLWNTSWLLSNDGALGKTLHTLIGYNAHPTGIEVLFYAGALASLLFLMTRMDKRSHGVESAIA